MVTSYPYRDGRIISAGELGDRLLPVENPHVAPVFLGLNITPPCYRTGRRCGYTRRSMVYVNASELVHV